MSKYRKGAYYERKVLHQLEKDGWYVVRSAGSKGALDLVAIKDGKVIGIQVKKMKQLSKAERENLGRLRERLGVPIFVVEYVERVGLMWEEIPPKGGDEKDEHLHLKNHSTWQGN